MNRRMVGFSLLVCVSLLAALWLTTWLRVQGEPSRVVHTDVTDFEAGLSDGGFLVRQSDDGELALAPTSVQLSPWTELSDTPLPQERYRHAVAASGRHLLVIGGVDSGGVPRTEVYLSRQQADGTLSDWQVASPLPQPLSGHTAVAIGQTILTVGGRHALAADYTDAVYQARLNDAGELSAWTELSGTPLPQPLAGHAAAVVGSSLYVSGGRSASGRQKTVYQADFRPDGTLTDWRTLLSLPEPLVLHQMAGVYDCLFVTGGESDTGSMSAVYATQIQPDGTINAWRDLVQARLPLTLQDHVMLAGQGRLIVIGGISMTGGAPFARSSVFWADVEPGCTLSAWEQLTESPLPRALVQAAGAVMDGRLYIIGGHSSTGLFYNETYQAEFIPEGIFGSWQTLTTTLPQGAARGSAGATANGRLYLTGGLSQTGPLTSAFSAAIQPDGDLGQWQSETPLPLPLAHHALLHLGDRFLLLGGNDGINDINTVYQAQIGADGVLGEWHAHPCPLPAPVSYHAALVWGGYVFVSGGRNGFAETDAVYRLQADDDGSQGCWQPISSLPIPLAAHAMTAAGNYLFVSGGFTQSAGMTVNSVYRASINSDGSLGPWSELNATPLPLYLWGHEMLARHGYLYALAGFEGTSLIEQHRVFRTPVATDGSLAGWQELPGSALPLPIFDAALAYDDLYLWLAGGKRNNQLQADIYSTSLDQGVAYAAYTGQFDLDEDQDMGVLDWRARGDTAVSLGVRYRIAPTETAAYGPWTRVITSSPLPVYDRGRYLQYQFLADNPDNGVKAIDEVNLTYGDVGDYVKAVDANGVGIAAAAVYLNGRFIGKTGALGILPPGDLPQSLAPGDRLVLLNHITQTNTIRDAHTTPDSAGKNWAYRTYLTNLDINSYGQILPYTVTQSGGQIITLPPDQPLILYNLLVSIEWDANITYTQQISRAVQSASDYLYDLSDGQMAFGQVAIFDNGQHWADADIQISAKNIVRPHAYIGGITSNDKSHVIRIGRGWDGASGNQGSWDAPDGYRTLTHEFGHYALYLYDEYFAYAFDQNGNLIGELPAYCTGPENRNPASDTVNASAMDYQYASSELSARGVSGMWSVLCEQTAQWQLTEQQMGSGESAWETLARHYADTQTPPRWQMELPADRGGVMAGPAGLPPNILALPTVTISNTGASEPARLLTVYDPDGKPHWSAIVALYKLDGRVLGQGLTDSNGQLDIYGAEAGDVLRAAAFDGGLAGHVTVSAVTNLELTLAAVSGLTRAAAQATTAIPHMRVIAEPGVGPGQIDLLVVLENFGPGADPSLVVTEPGSETGHAPILSYSPGTDTYEGQVSFSVTERGMGRIRAVGAVGNSLMRLQSTYRLQHAFNDQSQDIYADDGNMQLHLEPGSLPGNEAYFVAMPPGAAPGALPAGLVMVGDPYDVTASGALGALVKPGILTLNYDGVLVNQETPEGMGIYRWDPNGKEWLAVAGRLDEDQKGIAAPVTALGIYALLSPPVSPHSIFLPVIIKDAP